MGEKDIRGGCPFFVQTDLNIYLSFFKDSLFWIWNCYNKGAVEKIHQLKYKVNTYGNL